MAQSSSPYRKKLIEVALPLEAINVASAREKSIRHGHPSTLHLWWARRPLAACRAVLFASLVDDPDSDPQFRRPDGTVDEERAAGKRAELFTLIEDLVRWENSNNPTVINAARAEIARCVASRKIELGELKKDEKLKLAPPLPPADGDEKATVPPFTPYDLMVKGRCTPEQVNVFLAAHAPPVLDPFCGGGSIPLEAQRLGLRAYGSDLNPVPVLITKALIEIPPKFAGRPPVNPEWQQKSKQAKAAKVWEGAQGLAEDVRYYGKWMRDEAEKRIGHLYPKVKITKEMAKDRPDLKEYVGEELTVIAWLWARTTRCSSPACGATIPMARSFALSTKRGSRASAVPSIDRKQSTVTFQVEVVPPSAASGTVKSRAVTCLLCGATTPLSFVRDEGKAGRLGAAPLAVVADGNRERVYLTFSEAEAAVALDVQPRWKPEEQVPTPCHDVDRLPMYGMTTWGDAFTSRQLVALTTLCDLVAEVRSQIATDMATWSAPHHMIPGDESLQYQDAVAVYLAFLVDQLANHSSSLCGWNSVNAQMRNVFARHAIQMTWDFAEVNPFSTSTGSYHSLHERMIKAFDGLAVATTEGRARQLDARVVDPSSFGEVNLVAVSTDPPYYDNISYADVSDYFYVWLRRCLRSSFPTLFSTVVTPKAQELIASPYRHDSRAAAQRYFEKGLSEVFARVRLVHDEAVPLTVYYAFKQSEMDESDGDDELENGGTDKHVVSTGWETMLEGLVIAGFSIHGTWPLRTEKKGRVVGIGTNALASSVAIVCRPRPVDAPLATRKQFLAALHKELPEALKNLQRGNIAPVDLAQASIGPGMAVFTRYSKVMESDGTPMTVRTALGLINQSLDEVLAEQEGEFDADTRWALAWFEQFGMADGPFGVAETLSKAKNTAVNGLVEAGVIAAKSGKVRLVPRDKLDLDWNPTADSRLTIWETTQHLIHRLDKQGEEAAAALLHQFGGMAEIARDLAYRLYVICERKKWAEDALAYNGLVIAWPELTKLAQAAGRRVGADVTQTRLFE